MSSIALVLSEYNHPAQPYLTRWMGGLCEAGLPVRLFARHSAGEEDVVLLDARAGIAKALRLARNVLSHPAHAARWLAGGTGPGLRSRLSIYGEFGALLVGSPSMIHLVNSPLYPSFAPMLDATRIPFAVSFRGFDILVRPLGDSHWAASLARLFDRAHRLHFVSEYLMRVGIERGAPPAKCRVIYPGIDVGFFAPPEPPRSGSPVCRLASVGRLVWQKGLEYALQAVRLLRQRGVRVQYRIAGEGPERDQILFWRQMLGLEDCVELVGRCDPPAVRRLLFDSDIFVQPSLTESICVAVMEAAATGLPVVSTNAGGLPESTCAEGALLVPPADPAALAEALAALAGDRDRRERMGHAGRQWVVERFSVDNEVRLWREVYSC